jgi:hypothetical protein
LLRGLAPLLKQRGQTPLQSSPLLHAIDGRQRNGVGRRRHTARLLHDRATRP